MSAIWMRCLRCDGRYIAGMVGTRMWPLHVCPDGTRTAEAVMEIPPELRAEEKAG